MAVQMNAEDLGAFLRGAFEQVADDFVIDEVREMGIRIRMPTADRHLRPGGTVSGPSMFALADVCVYLALLAQIGPKALAVTTNVSMDFMRKPAAGVDLIGDCTILKLGKALAVADVRIASDGQEDLVARASMTYSIPRG